MGAEDSKYISIPDSSIIVRVANTTITAEIERNDIFLLSNIDNYKVVDINSVIEPGLIVFKMEWCSEEQEIPVHTISILNNTPLQITQSQPLILNVAVCEDGILLDSPPTYSFSSSDEEIATINDNGEVSALGLGIVTFTVVLDNDDTVSNSINVEIIADENEIDNFTVELINPYTSILKNQSKSINCIFKNNGIAITKKSEFYLTNDDGTSPCTLATIQSQDSDKNSCVVLAGNTLGYFRIFTKDLSGKIVSDGFRVQVKNIF
jgi:hypothetical protein